MQQIMFCNSRISDLVVKSPNLLSDMSPFTFLGFFKGITRKGSCIYWFHTDHWKYIRERLKGDLLGFLNDFPRWIWYLIVKNESSIIVFTRVQDFFLKFTSFLFFSHWLLFLSIDKKYQVTFWNLMFLTQDFPWQFALKLLTEDI